jgi:hypothetical protein
MNIEILPIPAQRLAEVRGGGRDDDGNPFTPFTVTEGGAPLRCCLRDARPGERIGLISYHPVRRSLADLSSDDGASTGLGPYDEAGPVFVHACDCPGPGPGGYPEQLRRRDLVLRCYGPDGRILGGTVAPAGDGQEDAMRRMLGENGVAFVHARNVVYGCFLADVRATTV